MPAIRRIFCTASCEEMPCGLSRTMMPSMFFYLIELIEILDECRLLERG
jgi:hypothetical protein